MLLHCGTSPSFSAQTGSSARLYPLQRFPLAAPASLWALVDARCAIGIHRDRENRLCVEAAIAAVVGAGSSPQALVVSTHGLLVGEAAERLGGAPIRRLVFTDSVKAGLHPYQSR